MSRRNASRSNSSAGKPAWVWFVLGNFVGGFVVFLIFLNGLKPDAGGAVAGKRQAAAERRAEDKSEQPRFDFYTLLKENEVSVPPPKGAKPAKYNSAAADKPAADSGAGAPSRTATSGERSAPASDPALIYILQVGSFRDASEAERLRAQLTLSNLAVKVESATDSRGTWHRVLVGPFASRSNMAKAREVLADHKLVPLVLKRPANS